MFPPDVQKTVVIYHLATTASQSQAYSAGDTVTAAFLPLDRKEHMFEGGDLVEPYELYFDPSVDVREGDKLVINAVNYYCKKVVVFNFGGLPHKRVSISTDARVSHA